jgi:hypothetical protein
LGESHVAIGTSYSSDTNKNGAPLEICRVIKLLNSFEINCILTQKKNCLKKPHKKNKFERALLFIINELRRIYKMACHTLCKGI